MGDIKYLDLQGLQYYHNLLKQYIAQQGFVSNLTSGDNSITINNNDIRVHVDDATIKVDNTGKLYVNQYNPYSGSNTIDIDQNNNISVIIKSDDKFLSAENTGLHASISLLRYTGANAEAFGLDVKEAYVLVDKNGNPIYGDNNSQVIKIYKNISLNSATYGTTGTAIDSTKDIDKLFIEQSNNNNDG